MIVAAFLVLVGRAWGAEPPIDVGSAVGGPEGCAPVERASWTSLPKLVIGRGGRGGLLDVRAASGGGQSPRIGSAGPALPGALDLTGYQRALLTVLFGASIVLWTLALILRHRKNARTVASAPATPPAGEEPRPSDREETRGDGDPLDWEPLPPPWARR